ncbi:MAG: hypothetical protein R2932_33785 [Caldilineaceae bacterium]
MYFDRLRCRHHHRHQRLPRRERRHLATQLLLTGDAGWVGDVDRGDIVRFTPTTLGESTAGSFSWVLDGSDVELEAIAENIDGIARIPDGRLAVSTYGSFDLTGLSGDDSDLIVFNATTWGEATAGSWELYFDGSDVALTLTGEDIADLC